MSESPKECVVEILINKKHVAGMGGQDCRRRCWRHDSRDKENVGLTGQSDKIQTMKGTLAPARNSLYTFGTAEVEILLEVSL